MRHTVGLALLIVALHVSSSSASGETTDALWAEVTPLIEMGLASEDIAVHTWAIRAASRMDAPAFRDAAAAAIENANPLVRVAAARALIERGESLPLARATLAAELVEGDAALRSMLLNDVLVRLGEDVRREVIGLALDLTDDPTTTRDIVSHLAQRADGPVHALLERSARIEDAEERAVYVQPVLQAARPEGLAVAAALLASRDEARQLEGAEIVFAVNTAEARAMLEPLLQSSDAALAQRAGLHLARYGNPAALALAAALARNVDMPEELRMRAIRLIRNNGPQLVTWGEVQQMLEEAGRSPQFRTALYELAGATRDPGAIAHLRSLLDALFADERLEGIAGYGYTGQLDGVATMAEIVSSAGDLELRLRAARALGHLGGDMAADALIRALATERVDEVKVAIVTALGDTGSSRAPTAIANAFALQNEAISLAALDALMELRSSEVAAQVESVAIGARSPAVRWRATVVLTHLDPELGRLRLIQGLDRPPAGFIDDLKGLPQGILDEVDERLLRHADPSVREAALFRVMRRPDRGYSVLRPMVDGQASPDIRRQAISVATAAGKAEDAAAFVALMSDTDRSIRLQGMAALAELRDPQYEATFRGYLNHADVALRLIAVYGLISIAR